MANGNKDRQIFTIFTSGFFHSCVLLFRGFPKLSIQAYHKHSKLSITWQLHDYSRTENLQTIPSRASVRLEFLTRMKSGLKLYCYRSTSGQFFDSGKVCTKIQLGCNFSADET
ncbi:hypothetical protein PV325_012896 [Microctonus aethiopoides]|uniref:Uncharacterized protein n=1 Tax=Microctonus aethiopoides TaxID=144406 RepID=A0AA39F9W8_9HYME|nr:hypothetical protein PV325_012896 [Microctonus aethiopoides]KAK0165647.1 hypothetical protein PV328_004149 [Microctonus aethiopoides]